MNAQNVLAGLLAAQILLAGVTWWPRTTTEPEPRPILPFDASAIREVTVESSTTRSKESPLQLVGDGTSWKLANAFDYPADPSKVQEVIDKLAAIRLGRPVATSATAHDQLNVGATNATRQVKVGDGTTNVEFYVGTSGSSRSFVRVAGEDAVYEVAGLGAWSIKDAPNAYFDGEWVKVDAGTLTSWTLTNARGTVALERGTDGTWTAQGLSEGALLSQQAVGTLLDTTLTVSTSAPLDPALSGVLQGPDALVVSWATQDGTRAGYRIAPHDGALMGQRDGASHPVRVSSAKLRKALEETTLDSLLVAPPTP